MSLTANVDVEVWKISTARQFGFEGSGVNMEPEEWIRVDFREEEEEEEEQGSGCTVNSNYRKMRASQS